MLPRWLARAMAAPAPDALSVWRACLHTNMLLRVAVRRQETAG